jgi:hypothetical protein
VTLDLRQHHLAHLGQHFLVRPPGIADKMQERLVLRRKEQCQFPSFETFPDILQPKLDAGKVIIDSTRFVADQYLSQLNRELPYATLRICILAAENFNADYVIAAASAQHQEFYGELLTICQYHNHGLTHIWQRP